MTDTNLVLKTMLDHDNFSAWMGIVVDEYREGYCKLHYTITEAMLNGFGIVHGGIVFSGSDSAFAFACNSHGQLSVALDVHISFINAARAGDVMTVEAKELHTGNKVSFYDVTTTNEEGKIVAVFKGTAYRTGKKVVDAGKDADH
ncbi:MAG: thioesterase [Flavipsychrobacter sp.]|jgi:acyl-CoA thioesterase|nr:thioesterase [Flavipsychrobacter sp.]